MTTSTTSDRRSPKKRITVLRKAGAVLFWLLLWQVLSMALGQKLLLCSPIDALLRLLELLPAWDFWRTVLFSLSRITLGFLLACLLGTALAALSGRFSLCRELFSPLMGAVRSVPVASFIILILLWVPSKNLSVVIPLLMASPVFYANVLEGLSRRDRELFEMARVFRVPPMRRLRYLTVPQAAPYFRSACQAGLGLCWKAGAAAEVIGLPQGSIGERLYEAKIYLETPDLFAWTAVIVLLSMACEKLFLFLLDALLRRLKREGRME